MNGNRYAATPANRCESSIFAAGTGIRQIDLHNKIRILPDADFLQDEELLSDDAYSVTVLPVSEDS